MEMKAMAIDKIYRILCAIRAHGRNVVIFKDAHLGGNANSIPNKLSLSRAHCNKIFKKSKLEGGSNKIWKDILYFCKNFLSRREAKRAQLNVVNF